MGMTVGIALTAGDNDDFGLCLAEQILTRRGSASVVTRLEHVALDIAFNGGFLIGFRIAR